MESMEPGHDGRVELKEGIKLSQLLRGDDVVFTLKHGDAEDKCVDYEYETADELFSEEEIKKLNLDAELQEEEYGKVEFEELKSKMTKVTGNGSVMKKIIREGIREVIPQDAVVRINYDGYFEFNDVPFDSTTLRGRAEEFIIGSSGLVAGLDIAVSTMRDREKAQFILQPSVAYGRLGCPPRIPPNAEVLFIIEVMSWKVGSEAAVARAISNEKGEKKWGTCKEAVRALVKEAISLYNEKRFKDCKSRLERAKQFLEKCHLKDEEEEEEHKSYMFKVSLNLAMAYNELVGSPAFAPSAISNCQEALKIKPNSGKAQLNWGIALIKLGELDRAKTHMLKAKRLLPSCSKVDEWLDKLETKLKSSLEAEKAQWKKGLGFNETVVEKKRELSEEEKEIMMLLQEFKASSRKEMVLPNGISSKEKQTIRDLAADLNLEVNERATSFRVMKI